MKINGKKHQMINTLRESGYSVTDIAKAMGVSTNTISLHTKPESRACKNAYSRGYYAGKRSMSK